MAPDYRFELALSGGRGPVAGVDEAGRGPLAGPVVAAAVILTPGTVIPGLDDGKRLAPGRRVQVAGLVREQALSWAVGVVDVEYIEREGILAATHLAMHLALEGLTVRPSFLLVDGGVLPGVNQPQWGVIRGDALCCSVAAASVLAKVHRDAIMEELDARYPGYGLARHKGYATREHRVALARMGPSPCHRLSFLSCPGIPGEDDEEGWD
ncbi:MAG: ribonuclease HII [Bacillota bacterium]|nr:ribonuclease HII [Bacillota bacterium]MDI7249632.1 ribonuclease HII [Bacillota bacterium]